MQKRVYTSQRGSSHRDSPTGQVYYESDPLYTQEGMAERRGQRVYGSPDTLLRDEERLCVKSLKHTHKTHYCRAFLALLPTSCSDSPLNVCICPEWHHLHFLKHIAMEMVCILQWAARCVHTDLWYHHIQLGQNLGGILCETFQSRPLSWPPHTQHDMHHHHLVLTE
jgi:hypothetical protein